MEANLCFCLYASVSISDLNTIYTVSALSLYSLAPPLHYLCRYQVSFFFCQNKNVHQTNVTQKDISQKEILANKIFAEKEILPNNIFLFFIGARGILGLKSCLI